MKPLQCIGSLITLKFQLIAYTKGNIQKLNHVIFLALDTKSSDLPTPLRVQFCGKKINPRFFLEIESMIAKTNFTLGSIEKFIFFVKL